MKRERILEWAILLGCCIGMMSCFRPIADFTHHPSDENTAPCEIEFKNQSNNAEEYVWNFGDGQTSVDEEPIHKYVLSGSYQVTLEAKKKNKTNTMVKQIDVKAPEECVVLIETDFGNIEVVLYEDTPLHRENFVKLADKGFYDDLLFHRVIDGFMIQGGDPNSLKAKKGDPLGSGGPGYQIGAEMQSEFVHVKGAIAAARMGDSINPEKKSSGSQFYIVQGSPVDEHNLDRMEMQKGIKYTPEQRKAYLERGGTPFLDMDYTVFGEVRKGLEVIDTIAKAKTDGRARPLEDVKMKITVIK